MKRANSYFKPMVVTGVVLTFLIGITIVDTVYRSRTDAGDIIAQDIQFLHNTFQKIHRDCGIIDFDAQKKSYQFFECCKIFRF